MITQNSFHETLTPEEHAVETYRSLISVSTEGLKTVLLINGGAVVALLTFLGQADKGQQMASKAGLSVGAFLFGVVLCAISFVASYWMQHALFNERRPQYKGLSHNHWTWIASLIVAASLAAFVVGAISSVSLLTGSKDLAKASVDCAGANAPQVVPPVQPSTLAQPASIASPAASAPSTAPAQAR